MRGASISNGQSIANGQSSGNGNGLFTLVKNHQGDGFQVRSISIWDFTEPSLIP